MHLPAHRKVADLHADYVTLKGAWSCGSPLLVTVQTCRKYKARFGCIRLCSRLASNYLVPDQVKRFHYTFALRSFTSARRLSYKVRVMYRTWNTQTDAMVKFLSVIFHSWKIYNEGDIQLEYTSMVRIIVHVARASKVFINQPIATNKRQLNGQRIIFCCSEVFFFVRMYNQRPNFIDHGK